MPLPQAELPPADESLIHACKTPDISRGEINMSATQQPIFADKLVTFQDEVNVFQSKSRQERELITENREDILIDLISDVVK